MNCAIGNKVLRMEHRPDEEYDVLDVMRPLRQRLHVWTEGVETASWAGDRDGIFAMPFVPKYQPVHEEGGVITIVPFGSRYEEEGPFVDPSAPSRKAEMRTHVDRHVA